MDEYSWTGTALKALPPMCNHKYSWTGTSLGNFSGTVSIPTCSGFSEQVIYEIDPSTHGLPNPICWRISYHSLDQYHHMNVVGVTGDLNSGGLEYYHVCREQVVNKTNCGL